MHGHKDERTKDELAALGYERADVGLRTIAVWVFWFFAFAVAAGVATAGIYQVLVPGGLAPAKMERERFPKAPALQDEVTVKTDIYDLRAAEEEQLKYGGPSKHVKGAYSIPVDLAIKKWAQQNNAHDITILDGSPDVIIKPEPSSNGHSGGGTQHAPQEGAQPAPGGGH